MTQKSISSIGTIRLWIRVPNFVTLHYILTLSPPIPFRRYTLPQWSNSPFLFLTFGHSGTHF